jgi:hypothetical protein
VAVTATATAFSAGQDATPAGWLTACSFGMAVTLCAEERVCPSPTSDPLLIAQAQDRSHLLGLRLGDSKDTSRNNTPVRETALSLVVRTVVACENRGARPGLRGPPSTAAPARPIPHSRPGFPYQQQQYAHVSETS